MTHPFEEKLRKAGLLPPIQQSHTNGHTLSDTDKPYALAALRQECDLVANAAKKTRNHTLNKAAFNLASLVTAGHLDRTQVENALTDAAHIASRNGDHPLTDSEIEATIASGFSGSATKVGARQIPEQSAQVTETSPDTLTPNEQQDLHQLAVARRAYELRINDEARIVWTRQRAAALGQQPPPLTPLPELLAQPDLDATYRVTDLLPAGGRVLLAAQYKAGKTSLVANLLRSLADGDLFLGRYHTAAVDRIILIDTELDENMLRRWLRDQNIRSPDKIATISMRGRLSTFGIIDDHTRAEWAATLTGTDFIILDCLRPCLDALGLSEDKDAGVFLTAFDALCKECGATEAAVVHHMGHTQERSRGDSRLLDWPDVLWKIVRDNDEDGNNIEAGDRFFSAIGRDVNIPEAQLEWQPETRALTVCGGGRNDKKARNAVGDIIELMNQPDHIEGLSFNQLVNKLKGYGIGRNVARAAIQKAVDDMVLITVTGPRNTHLHTLNPSRRSR